MTANCLRLWSLLAYVAFAYALHWSVSPKAVQVRKNIRVLVDMDNTIADFDDKALELLRARVGNSAVKKSKQGLRQYPFKANFEASLVADIGAIIRQQHFFSSLPPITGAIEALKEMQAQQNIEVYLCTTPFLENPFCASEKFQWVREHFGSDGSFWEQRLIITSNKSLVHADLLIDDNPEAVGEANGAVVEPSWEHVWFSRPYNDRLTGHRRLDRWANWRSIIFNAPTDEVRDVHDTSSTLQ